MLIIKIVEPVLENKKPLFKKHKVKEGLPKRISFKINNKIFNVIETPKDYLDTEEFSVLLNRYNGRILKTNDENLSCYNGIEYFKPTDYLQRSVISSVIKIIKCDVKKNSVLLKGKIEKDLPELYDLACVSKGLAFESDNKNLSDFYNYCYNRLGLKVLTGEKNESNYNLIVDFNKQIENFKIMITYNDKSSLINADAEYFHINNDVKKLMDLGVDFISACAVIYE